ncbi:3' 5'-cyclic adenosine monophosphate phosphodiesterase CpdA [termite gut metagenome]|uniref:3' 5'-cyclic adenosine monophosphate phosphodiesterase CpdA n=1 Tax=termite gut metagenome TaxID=433724 RepID=A0A5J4SJ37_9ZZZZ
MTAFLLCTFVNADSPRFAVISDIHFGSKAEKGPTVKVPQALKNILGKERLDALFIVGDLTNNGKEEEYDQLKSVFDDKTIVPEGIAVYSLSFSIYFR